MTAPPCRRGAPGRRLRPDPAPAPAPAPRPERALALKLVNTAYGPEREREKG